MKAHIQLPAIALAISIASYSQEDTLSVLPPGSDTVRIYSGLYHNPLMRGDIHSKKGASVDAFVLALNTEGQKGKDIETLSHLLTDSFDTDAEKVRAIFFWVAQNISYDVKKYHNKKSVPFKCRCKSRKGHRKCIEKWEWELAREALIKRKGVCMDYALLFYYLCDFAEIECRYITGYAINHTRKLSTSMSEKAGNHAWNAVMIEGKWHLLDVTWASGYTDKGVKHFTQSLDEYYYLTPPEKMISDHHPKEKKWQLLERPLKMKEFVELHNNSLPQNNSLSKK